MYIYGYLTMTTFAEYVNIFQCCNRKSKKVNTSNQFSGDLSCGVFLRSIQMAYQAVGFYLVFVDNININ